MAYGRNHVGLLFCPELLGSAGRESERIRENYQAWVRQIRLGSSPAGGGPFFYWGIAQGRIILYYGCINSHGLWERGQEHEEKNYGDADRAGDAARDDAGDGECD